MPWLAEALAESERSYQKLRLTPRRTPNIPNIQRGPT
jgi:hypothetical protein